MDWALYREALILEEAGKLEEAILALKKLVGTSSDPGENSLPYLEIANCLRGLGRHGEAREYLRKAYETFGEDHRYYPNVMFIDASIEEEVGNYDAGLEKLDSIIKSFPDFLTNSLRKHKADTMRWNSHRERGALGGERLIRDKVLPRSRSLREVQILGRIVNVCRREGRPFLASEPPAHQVRRSCLHARN